MKGDAELLSELHKSFGWTWWRTRRRSKNGSKGGYKIQTGAEVVFIRVSELPEFYAASMKRKLETPK